MLAASATIPLQPESLTVRAWRANLAGTALILASLSALEIVWSGFAIASVGTSWTSITLCVLFLIGAALSFLRVVEVARWVNLALFVAAVFSFVSGAFGYLPVAHLLPIWLTAFAAVMTAAPRIFDAVAGPFIAFFRHTVRSRY